MHVYHQFESHFNGHHFLLRNSINSHFPLKSSRVDDLFTDDFQKAALPRIQNWIEFSNSPLVSRKILLDSGAIDEPCRPAKGWGRCQVSSNWQEPSLPLPRETGPPTF